MQDCHLRKEPNVTEFSSVSPGLHDEEPKPPSTGRGWRRRRRRIEASVLSKIFRCSSGLHPAADGQATKGKRPYGQARRFPFIAQPNYGGKVVAPATKGGCAFPSPEGRLYGFLFSHGRSPVVKVLYKLAAEPPTTPFEPCEPSRPKAPLHHLRGPPPP